MANRFRRLLSFGSDSRNQNIVNSNEQRTWPIYRAPSPDNFANWVMPRMDIDTLYKIGLFEFKKAYSVKTHEEAINLQNGVQSIGMVSPIAIAQHLQAKYRFMHIGLVQVAVKPLLRTGVNAPIYLALRDKRLHHYKSSLLAMIQTNVCKGPIFLIVIQILWLIYPVL